MNTSFQLRFSPEDWKRLASLGRRVTLAPGTLLVRRGDPPGCLHVLLSGRVEILDPRTTPPTILGVVGAGDPIGDISFLGGVPATADVRVLDAGEALRLRGDALHAALEAEPDLGSAFHRALSTTLVQRLGQVTSTAVAGAFSAGADSITPDDRHEGADDPYLAARLDPDPLARCLLPERGRITIGRGRRCDLRLQDPRVARMHAEVVHVPGAGHRVVAAPGEAVLVDGDWTVSAPLTEGSVLGVGRARVRVEAGQLVQQPLPPLFALHVEGVHKRIRGRTILQDIRFSVLSGEVVALVGPSGAGKSTLIHVMSGGLRPDSGTVRLGTEPIREVLRRHPTTTAEVPQDDIVLPELSVQESLGFAARLRAPGLSPSERERVINEVIHHLGLHDVRDSRIGDPARRGISGGQRKRVNIGQELISDDTRVIFLDEPTSGLDPRSSHDIARLARNLADEGRVVVMVTHDLDPALLAETDHVLVLAAGGHLAWFGPVESALDAFEVQVASQIFDRLPDRPADAWASTYAASRPAVELAERAEVELDVLDLKDVAPRPGWWRQLAVLTRRVAEVKRRDPTSTGVLVLQPLIIGAVMLLVFPRGTSGLLFLLVLACFWFGMSASVRELIADAVVWRRERRIGLFASAWVLSKALVIGAIVGIQAAALAIVAHLGVGLGSLGFSLPALAATAVLTGWVGMGTGLLVSAAWRRSDAAVGTIVLLLVPQIAFSGLLMPLSDVSPVAWGLSWATPVRYAFHLALQTGAQIEYFKLGAFHARPISGELFLLGLRPAGAGELGLSWAALAGILGGLVLVQIAATIALVARR